MAIKYIKFDETSYQDNDWGLNEDLKHLEPDQDLVKAIARAYGYPPALIAGMGSRESGWGRLLGKWGNPPDTGDKGHGRGVMQIDDRYHKHFLAAGKDWWRDWAANIAYGCHELSNALAQIRDALPDLEEEKLLRAAVAAYNCGSHKVIWEIEHGRDVDSKTTGQDYSQDVFSRAGWFQKKGW